MRKIRIEFLMGVMFLALMLLASIGSWAHAGENDDLQSQVDVLAEEIARLREQMAIPETDEGLSSAYGMGPAASKVYGERRGVALGGYGEFYFQDTIDGDNTADMYRFITYVGYKFSDRIVMNTEIEFEHGTTDASGEVSVEFSYLDFLLHENFNARAGNLLVPMGFVNELHEPPFYRGNIRPSVERLIIPSTWRELGAGAHGQLGGPVRYTAYVLNGMNAEGFEPEGIREGRQSASKALWNDVGGVLALDYETASFGASASGYYGGADQGQILDAMDDEIGVSNWIGELHGYWRRAGIEFRALVAVSGIDGADELSVMDDPGTTEDETFVVPEQQLGWYVEAAYDVAPLIADAPGYRVEPWVRFEDYDLQHSVADGFVASDALDYQSLTAGVHFMPHDQVVIKGEWEHRTTAADDSDATDDIRVGAGFIF
jgi:hypothetical protein